MKNKYNCLVFGGGGFIGSHLCDTLLEEGYNVRIFERLGFDKRNILHLLSKIEVIEGDFNNAVNVRNALVNIDYVFHFISSTNPSISMESPYFDVEANLIPTISFLQEAVKIKKIKKVVFLSSGGTVYGIPSMIPIPESHQTLPICSYGIIKNTIEHYFMLYQRLFGLNCTIFRLSNPYGERQNPYGKQGAIAVFLNKIILNQTIEIWGDGEIVRDYIYVKDITKILIDSLKKQTENIIYNIGSGEGLSLNQLLDVMKSVTGREIKVEYMAGRSFDVPVNVLDTGLVYKDFNWTPTVGIDDGILKFYTYLQEYHEK